jgi:5-oxopent-3-ene-1,2,5-tricarboxylate decarboxylase/2-hydroxyhepta-2,4-diene-1,7-dioate isomerase
MRVARVVHGGAIHTAYPVADHPQHLRLANGEVVGAANVQWLAPFKPRTIVALGLNYADHVKELAGELTVTNQDEPLVFLKGPNSVVGHRGHTPKPADVAHMHYECELAVVIGRTAQRVPAEQALAHVLGYTICNDYAFREYLENWYRPNLRVKNRDQATALGPWLVPASEIPDPQNLSLRTLVNGQLVQQGHTSHMIHSVANLIAYLSGFMTLQAGDVILTGTPDGVTPVQVGDEVVTAIDGLGELVNHVVSTP